MIGKPQPVLKFPFAFSLAYRTAKVGGTADLESEDIRPQDESGHVAGEREDTVNSLKSWVNPIQPDVVIPPKQKIALDFTIEVPANADPGSHWGGVVVRTAPVLTGSGEGRNDCSPECSRGGEKKTGAGQFFYAFFRRLSADSA